MVGYEEGHPFDAPTLPQALRDGGYTTAVVGRYMHQSPYERSYGYDTRILGSTYILDDDYARMFAREAPSFGGVRGVGLSYNGWQARPWPLAEHLHPTHWTIRQARELIDRHNEKVPLFLTTSFLAPHPPLFPPAFYMDRYLRLDLPRPSIGSWAQPPPNDGLGVGVDAHRTVLRGEGLRSAQAGYYGLINHLDDQLYWLITEFKAKSVAMGRLWVILFTTDHGEMLGDHYFFRKCEPYEGASRIPFLIQGSEELGLASGVVCDSPVCLEDILPTLLDLAGLATPESVDGASLVPILRGAETQARQYLHGEHAPCYSEDQAYHLLTDGLRKYVWRPLDGSEQLFDLRRDPQELYDLHRETRMSAELTLWRQRMIERLRDRPEGFTDGVRLVAGRPYNAVLPHAR